MKGKGLIDVKNNKTLLNRLKEAIINPFNIVLILVAVVTFFTDVVIQEKKDYLTFTIIISTIIISSLISFLIREAAFAQWLSIPYPLLSSREVLQRASSISLAAPSE